MRRLIQRRVRFSLQSVLFILSIAGVTVFLTITSLLLYNNTETHIKQRLDLINATKFNQIVSDIEYFFDSTYKIVDYLKNDKQLIHNIRKVEHAETDPFAKHQTMFEIKQNLLNIQSYNEHIKNIMIVTEHLMYYPGEYLTNYEWIKYEPHELADGIRFYYPDTIFTNVPDKKQEVFFQTSLIDDHVKYGEMFVLLNDKQFDRKLSDLDHIMIIGESGETIFQGKHFNAHSGSANAKNQTYQRKLRFQNWTVQYQIDVNVYREQLELIRKSAFFAFVISLLLTIIFSRYLSRRILLQAFRLTSLVKTYNIGDPMIDDAMRANIKMKVTMREKIFYYLIITIIVPVCCFVMIYYAQSYTIIHQNIISAYSFVFKKTVSDLSDYMEKAEKLLVGLSFSSAVQNTFNMPEARDYQEIAFDTIEQFGYLGLGNGKYSLYSPDNRLILSNGFRQTQQIGEPMYADLQQVSRKTIWRLDKDKNNQDMIHLGMNVIGLANGIRMGYAVIEIDYKQFTEIYLDVSGDAETFVLGLNNNEGMTEMKRKHIASHMTESSGIVSIRMDGSEKLLFYEKIGSRNEFLVSLFDNIDINKLSFAVVLHNIYTLAVLLLIVIFMSFYISWTLLKPINRISNMLDYPESVQFEKLSESHFYIVEVQELYIKFYNMIKRIEELADDLLIVNEKKHAVEIAKNTAEIRALQAQINPHFLQNTLDSTIYLIKNNDKDRAVEMIKSLSSLFRFGISKGENIIEIQEELKYVRAYVTIINIRHSRKIQFIWQIDESLMSYKTLKLTLQPIIENAISHGIFHQAEGSRIWIECVSFGDQIRFKVTDNGKGIPEEILLKLQNSLHSHQSEDSVGLYNVHNRIRLYFGDAYGLHIESAVGEGTSVTLTIPKIKDSIDEDESQFG